MFQPSHLKLWAVAAGSWQSLKTMGCGSRFLTATYNYGLWQPVPIRYPKRENDSCLCRVLRKGLMKDKEWMCCDCVNGGASLSFVVITTSSFCYFTHHDKSNINACLQDCQFKSCNMSQTLDVMNPVCFNCNGIVVLC
jgi:hypothetical protein